MEQHRHNTRSIPPNSGSQMPTFHNSIPAGDSSNRTSLSESYHITGQEDAKISQEIFDTGGSLHLSGNGTMLNNDASVSVTTAAGSTKLHGLRQTTGQTKVKAVNCPKLREKTLVSAATYLQDHNLQALLHGTGGSIRDSAGKEVHRLQVKQGIYYINPQLYRFLDEHSSHHVSFLQFEDSPTEEVRNWHSTHSRFGHQSDEAITKLIGQRFIRPKSATCIACMKGSLVERNYDRTLKPEASRVLGLVGSDTVGKLFPTLNGEQYWSSFLDHCSGKVIVILHRKKGDLQTLWPKVARQEMKNLHSDISRFVHDGARELSSQPIKSFMDEEGIKDSTTIPYTPSTNGRNERINRTLNAMARKLLIQAHLPLELWGYAVKHSATLYNAAPRKTKDGWISPDSKYYNLEQDEVFRPIKHSLTFGEYAVALKSKKLRDGKFGSVATDAIYLGLDDAHEFHLLLDLKTNTPFRARTFKGSNKFLSAKHWKDQGYHMNSDKYLLPENDALEEDNNQFINTPLISTRQEQHSLDFTSNEPDLQSPSPIINAEQGISHIESKDSDEKIEEEVPIEEEIPGIEEDDDVVMEGSEDEWLPTTSIQEDTTQEQDEQMESHSEVDSRPQRNRKAPIRYDPSFSYAIWSFTTQLENGTDFSDSELEDLEPIPKDWKEPKSYKEAAQNPRWVKSMKREIKALLENDTWTLSPLPSGRQPIRTKWIFKIKRVDGQPYQLKSRLVACGYSQKKNVDFFQTFGAVGSKTAMRIMVALTAKLDLSWHQCDINNAYLKSTLQEEVFMSQPSGFGDGTNRVCRLNKTLYGLRQSANAWYQTISGYLESLGYRTSDVEPCVFLYKGNRSLPKSIFLYVDDMLLVGRKGKDLTNLLELLDKRFGIKDLGAPEFLLGIKVCRDEEGIFLSQEAYIEEILDTFDKNCDKICSSPMSEQLEDCGELLSAEEKAIYHSIIGSLLWLSICTRPDISYAASVLGSNLASPQRSHLEAAIQVLRYLRGTKSEGLFYSKDGALGVNGFSDKYKKSDKRVRFLVEEEDTFSDADYAGCKKSRRSRSGVYISLDKVSSPVMWISRLQQETSLSSCESELYAAVECYKEYNFVRILTREIMTGVPRAEDDQKDQPMIIQMDNEATKTVLENTGSNRLKHVAVRHFFLRNKVKKGDVILKHVDSKSNKADIFTKPFSGLEMKRLRNLIGMRPKEDVGDRAQSS